MGEFERIITMSVMSKNRETLVIEPINIKGVISVQVSKNTKIKYNNEEIELERTRIFTKEDVISNMNITTLDNNVKIYITIRYKENTGSYLL